MSAAEAAAAAAVEDATDATDATDAPLRPPWQVRGIRHPSGFLLWVVEENGEPFALVPETDRLETRRRLATMTAASALAVELDELPDEPTARTWLRRFVERVRNGGVAMAPIHTAPGVVRAFLNSVLIVFGLEPDPPGPAPRPRVDGPGGRKTWSAAAGTSQQL